MKFSLVTHKDIDRQLIMHVHSSLLYPGGADVGHLFFDKMFLPVVAKKCSNHVKINCLFVEDFFPFQVHTGHKFD